MADKPGLPKAVGYHRDVGEGRAVGLYLQVRRSKREEGGVVRCWIYRYVSPLTGAPRYMGLGPADAIGRGKARELAREARATVHLGGDPIEGRLTKRHKDRAEAAARVTFKAAAEQFLAVHEAGWKNPKHRAQWKSTLETYAYPKLGARQIEAVDAALINETLADIWTTKAETASRTKQRIERVLEWVKGGRPMPTAGKSKRVKHQPVLPWRDIPAFMADLRGRDGLSAKALEFTILTAARTGATVGARWSEIDLKNRLWTVPMERAGTKLAKRDHRVPLTDRVIEILENLPREKGNDHVFVGAKNGAGLSNMAMLELTRSMAYPSITPGKICAPHGFRSTFRDWASETTNFPRMVAEMALAHASSKEETQTEIAYRRGDLFEKRKPMMQAWARYCQQKPKAARGAASNVVPIRQGA
jgi:integrase